MWKGEPQVKLPTVIQGHKSYFLLGLEAETGSARWFVPLYCGASGILLYLPHSSMCVYICIYICLYIFLLPFQLSIEGESWTCKKYELSFHRADTDFLQYQVSSIKSSKEITEFYFWKRCRAEPWIVVHIWDLIEMLICKIFCGQWCMSSV